MNRSYYSDFIRNFINENDESILGTLSLQHSFTLEIQQKNAWLKQVSILKKSLTKYVDGKVYFEFAIPRMGKRVDNILIINDLIIVIEFKIGDDFFSKHAIEQVTDYCLDLNNFHEGSHNKKLIPILVATKAKSVQNNLFIKDCELNVIKANEENFMDLLDEIIYNNSNGNVDPKQWENSIYKPTPTIIEAAQALYKGHGVIEISRHDAGAKNLSKTASCINTIITEAKIFRKKSICFLTGVPGAGKTLAGLNIATERTKIDENEHAVFLSGNGPLVEVLREALTRDEYDSLKKTGANCSKKLIESKTHSFIQNIHHFRDDNLSTILPPIEKVVVFDEAQRAWQQEQVTSFMKRKKGIEGFHMSEPEYLISVMNRHTDWCTIVCLIGGGQEINTGEAGVSEWIKALKKKYTDWDIHYSSLFLKSNIYLTEYDLMKWLIHNGKEEIDLHLSTSVRSFRSENVSNLVEKLLDCNNNLTQNLYSVTKKDYPIYLTRDLDKAKSWMKSRARGTERFGIIASSGGKRLRPLGVDVNNEVYAPYWFLNDSDDVRSSNHLEDIATEFDIQGLEIDWVCLAWDINFYINNGRWEYQKFKGTIWQKVKNEREKKFIKNTYRVLLTRARQGIIIFVPYGSESDKTRPIQLYNNIYDFLLSCGFENLD